MDIKTFVADTLTQILEGIREAQKRPGGGDVAAEGYTASDGGQLSNSYVSGVFTNVDFDISVVAGTKEGGGGVRVADAEFSDGSMRTSQNASRVKFSVPVRIPNGEKDTASSGYDF